MNPETVEVVLREHVRMCSDLHELLIEEGKIMRSTGAPPDEAFLQRKGEYLPVLEKGLELLQKINEDPNSISRALQPLVAESREQIMKLMMLDRENERLLLKTSLPPRMKQAYGKTAPGQVARAYSKYNDNSH